MPLFKNFLFRLLPVSWNDSERCRHQAKIEIGTWARNIFRLSSKGDDRVKIVFVDVTWRPWHTKRRRSARMTDTTCLLNRAVCRLKRFARMNIIDFSQMILKIRYTLKMIQNFILKVNVYFLISADNAVKINMKEKNRN